MTAPSRPATGRIAPSPTGGLHLGHARTFLAAWLSARSRDGRIVLRIEDIDASRVRPGSDLGMIADLRWLGLDWDDGPIYQSERTTLYHAALEVLKGRESVYPCTCTRADIARSASAPHEGDESPRYPGTCAHRSASDASSLTDRPYCWRFRVSPGAIGWDDLILGATTGDPHRCGGDFLVGRSTGEPSYQLAVVVDDAAMGVTEVVRGDDLVLSTPRQLLLYRSLGLPEPTFGHLPLVIGPDGNRLAKRDASLKLATLRDRGVDPAGLVANLAGSLGIVARASERPADWIGRYRAELIPPGPWPMRLDDLIQSP